MYKQGELQTVFEQALLKVAAFKSFKSEFLEVRFLIGSSQKKKRHPKMLFFRNVTSPIRLKIEEQTISGIFLLSCTLRFGILVKAVTGKEKN